MNSWQGTGCRRWKGQQSLRVKERGSERPIFESVCQSLPPCEGRVTKGAGQRGLSERFLSLLNNGLLSDTDTLPVCHFGLLIFCHRCLRGQFSAGAPARAPPRECLSVCVFLSSDCDLQSGGIVPAPAPLVHNQTSPPATTSTSRRSHPLGVTDRNQSLSSAPAQCLLPNGVIF